MNPEREKVGSLDVDRLAEDYGTLVSVLAHRMIQNKEIAKEAAQEVWYEILKSLPSFKGESELSTWIYTISKRTISKYSKKEKIASIEQLEKFRALAEIEYDGAEENKKEWMKERCDWCITALNHCLSNEARLIFIFKENVGLPYRQIAEVMQLTEENVRQINSRSIGKITNFMNDTCPLYNPSGSCKCRIRKQVFSIDFDKEYMKVRKMVQLADI